MNRGEHRIFLSILLGLGLLFQPVQAQSEADFQAFGKDVFRWLTDTSHQSQIEFIRIRTWKKLIDQQDLPAQEKAARKRRVDEDYVRIFQSFLQKSNALAETYIRHQQWGVKFEMLNFSYRPIGRNIYAGKIRFVFEGPQTTTTALFRFRFFYNGQVFGLMTPVEEEF